MILLVDNYDSFTYNLYQYICELGGKVRVLRNDTFTIDRIRRMGPSHIVVSPGPGRPEDAGLSIEIIRAFGPSTPILGVCLGHQALAVCYGGAVVRAPKPVHGKTCEFRHDGRGIFAGVANPFRATRYHSLVVRREDLPKVLRVSAQTEDGLVMGLRHRKYPVEGVQFHPESILTEAGKELLRNFLGRGGKE